MKTIYKIYATEYSGPPTLLATVDGNNIIGEFAEGTRIQLIGGGWPKVPPNEICNNGYIFTQIVQVPTRKVRRVG